MDYEPLNAGLITIAIAAAAWVLLKKWQTKRREEMERLFDEVPPNMSAKVGTDTDIEDPCGLCETKGSCSIVGHHDKCGRERT